MYQLSAICQFDRAFISAFSHIIVIGAGYVGLSNAVLLAQRQLATRVTLVDINAERVHLLQHNQAPIQDALIGEFLAKGDLNLTAVLLDDADFAAADLVIIATPTNYDVATGKFDTASVISSIERVRATNTTAPIVIKSTIPIGFSATIADDFANVLFMPEFLREGQALYDNLHPSRIIVGIQDTQNTEQATLAQNLIALYQAASQEHDTPNLVMPTTEAEAVKLFANSYLATRIAFFNELDSFAESYALDSRAIITGVGLDPRIGLHYNNPSFGYGGYCLPKDTQQLKANYAGIPANVIHAVVDANNTRKRFIAQQIVAQQPASVGIYRLSMKKDADNFRDSAILDIIGILRQHGIPLQIYEPSLSAKGETMFAGFEVVADLDTFLARNALIVANRWHDDLATVREKVYSRDVFGDS